MERVEGKNTLVVRTTRMQVPFLGRLQSLAGLDSLIINVCMCVSGEKPHSRGSCDGLETHITSTNSGYKVPKWLKSIMATNH